MTDSELTDLVAKAQAFYKSLSPSQKLRHDYMQKRSFLRGMCPDGRNYNDWCFQIDQLMPDAINLTDTEIGLILAK